MTRRHYRQRLYEEQLNLLPLIDILLLVIFFFMMGTTAKVYDAIAEMKLPTSESRGPKVADKQVPRISLTKDGMIWLNGEQVDAAALTEKLRNIHDTTGIEEALLQSDGEVTLQQLIVVTDVCRKAGITKVSPRVLTPQNPQGTPAAKP